jgi:alpha-L-fucosidase
MLLDRRRFLTVSAATACSQIVRAQNSALPPAPYGAIPSTNQLRWHDLATYAFLHFTVNTFTGLEWGNGDEDPNIFYPTSFDPDAILRDLKAGGLKGVILTCKHHDGFCLWPTKTTEHCIRNSGWRNGKGDVVRDISAAAERAGLKFGVYFSLWDRANPSFGKPGYIPVYKEQVKELLTNYGQIFELWFDGASGGPGYYGGAKDNRPIENPAVYYDTAVAYPYFHTLQPSMIIDGPGKADIRWVGNESGIAGNPCWATYPSQQELPPDAPPNGSLQMHQNGVPNGSLWRPAECDVSIRKGWFWHESQNSTVKTPEKLVDLYFDSVGRGANLLLNVPPNREGIIQSQDALSLAAYSQRVRHMFAHDLMASAELRPSSVRGGSMTRFGPQNLRDGNRTSYWTTDDSERRPELTIDLGSTKQIAVIRLREAILLGQRVRGFSIDAWQSNTWKEVTALSSIGSCRLIRYTDPLTTNRLRLRITDSEACVCLAELGVFAPVSL